MKSIKNRSWIFVTIVTIVTVGLSAFAASKKKKAKFPVVENVVGSAAEEVQSLTVKNRSAEALHKDRVLRKGQVLKDRALLKTGPESQLRIKLSADQSVILYPQSEIEFPAIHWEFGRVENIILKSGSVRLLCSTPCLLNMQTALSRQWVEEGDYIFSFNEKRPAVQLEVLRGQIRFSGLENEVSLDLKSGEAVEFIGEFEAGEIAYDTLLKGRRVARGKALPKVSVASDRLAQLLLEEENLKKKEKKKKILLQRKSDQICDAPWGHLNECVYQCLNNVRGEKICDLSKGAQCLRRRCNANGQWADAHLMGASESECADKDIVKACQY